MLVPNRAPPRVVDRGMSPRYEWYRGNEKPGANQNSHTGSEQNGRLYSWYAITRESRHGPKRGRAAYVANAVEIQKVTGNHCIKGSQQHP